MQLAQSISDRALECRWVRSNLGLACIWVEQQRVLAPGPNQQDCADEQVEDRRKQPGLGARLSPRAA
jgi:hypothetical protein